MQTSNRLGKITGVFFLTAGAFAACQQFHAANANGLSKFESVQCVASSSGIGADPLDCADTELPDCQIPDWFPTEAQDWAGITTSFDSYPSSSTVRFNELVYSPPIGVPYVDYRRFEHDWYSKIDTPYGPAVSSGGHMWNEYDGRGLIKSVSCDDHGTVSYP